MIGGNAGFGGRPELPWTPTVVQDILPVWCLDAEWDGGRFEIVKPEHELIKSLPLDKRYDWMNFYDGNKVILKQEAELLAQIGPTSRGEYLPFWATWDVGSGRAFAMIGDWTPDGGRVFMRWAYYGDFLMIFLTKNPIPSDLETIHRAKGMYLEFRSARSYLFSIMDFAEKFGANTDSVGLMVIEADLSHEDSVAHYIALDFEKALERLESSIG